MNVRRPLLSLGFVLLSIAATRGQIPANTDPNEPDFKIIVQGTFDSETLAQFNKRVEDYAALRSKLEEGLPPLVVTNNPDEINSFERRLAERIRRVRGSRRGQVFAPSMVRQVKQMLSQRLDAATIATIMDDGPAEFDVDVNDRYSKERPLATMPPNILLVLPDLPPGIEFRFVGRHLILRDARANIIIDEIPYAFQCRGCVREKDEDDPAAP